MNDFEFGRSDSFGNDEDSVYEEVITGLFGRTKGITVGDVGVSRKCLKTIYKSMKLKKQVFKKVLEAHNAVLEYGIATGNERVIVIDIATGATVDDQTGTSRRVEFYIPQDYKGDVITIHNHPNSTPFSPKDLYSFNAVKQTECLIVQCHTGGVYALIKRSAKKYKLSEKALQDRFEIIQDSVIYSDKSFREKGEMFVEELSRIFGWDFKKGAD